MLRTDVLLAILGMAAVTYLCRASGYAVLRLMRLPPFVEATLRNVPGPLFAAYVALALGSMDWRGTAAALPVVLVQWRTGNLMLSILVGVGSLALLRMV